jgi:2-oxoglutarate ferredoxin oxidoreductase subunit beta
MAEEKANRISLTEKDYQGAESTMCRGCGHDAISASIMRAFFESSVDPRKVIKMSGIGCSSKTPAYFLGQSFGFNAIHGRMSAVATGANIANHSLIPIGVSGDGDTAAIGLGNFCHMMRRNVNITYIVENNGVYGLTKGQFSATAEKGSVMKGGSVTFNNHEGSTKSLKYVKGHLDPIHDVDFIPTYENIEVDYKEGTDHAVKLHDGSRIILHKLGKDYDPSNKMDAVTAIHAAVAEGKFLTGLIYCDPTRPDFAEELELCETPLAELGQDVLQPSPELLDEINAELMK